MEDSECNATARSELIGFKFQVLRDFFLPIVDLLSAEGVAS